MTRRNFPRARTESALECLVPLKSPRDIPSILKEHGYSPPRRVGLELDVLPANLYLGYREILNVECSDVSPAIRQVRAIKSAYELALMRRGARFGVQVLRALPSMIEEGMSEIELAGKVEGFARSLGHQGLIKYRMWNNDMFYGHLMAGKSAAVPSYLASPTGGPGLSPAFPQGPGRHRIRRGEPILYDYAFVGDGYIVDQTRIFAIGSLPRELERAHAAMIEIQDAVARAAKPGVTGGEPYRLALDMAQERGYADHFQGTGPDRVTFVGHGVGIEIDEYPILGKGQAMPLEAGMVIAIEPKATFEGLGTVGIENTFLITKNGGQRLTLGSDEVRIVMRARARRT
jgi:Xaa-Pro aminopeptidase